MQILLIMLIVVLLAFFGPASGTGKTKSQRKADRRQRAGRIHQGLCRNSKTDRRSMKKLEHLESNCDISDHL